MQGFCCLLPLWPTLNSVDFNPIFPNLRDFPGDSFFSEYFTEILLSHIFGLTMVKYGILSMNSYSKLHAVIDGLFFFKMISAQHSSNNGKNWRKLSYQKILSTVIF